MWRRHPTHTHLPELFFFALSAVHSFLHVAHRIVQIEANFNLCRSSIFYNCITYCFSISVYVCRRELHFNTTFSSHLVYTERTAFFTSHYQTHFLLTEEHCIFKMAIRC